MDAATKKVIDRTLEKFPGRHYTVCEWRELFDPKIIEEAANNPVLMRGKSAGRYSIYWYQRVTEFTEKRQRIQTTIYDEPDLRNTSWKDIRMDCTCGKPRCVHLAATFLLWEKEHGPWIVWENEWDYKYRMKDIELDLKRQQIAEADKAMGTAPIAALEAFPGKKMAEPVYLDLEKVLKEFTTTKAAIHHLKEAVKQRSTFGSDMDTEQLRDGSRQVVFRGTYFAPLWKETVRGCLKADGLEIFHFRENLNAKDCYVPGEPVRHDGPEEPLDAYELSEIQRLWDYVNSQAAPLVTDESAEKFFLGIKAQREKSIRPVEEEKRQAKKANVDLIPRIVVDDGYPTLSFKIGTVGSKSFILKDCRDLIQAVDGEKELKLGKNEALHFSSQAIRPEAEKLYDFIRRNRHDPIKGTYQVSLRGAVLDNFYDMAQGTSCAFQDKTNAVKAEELKIGHRDIHFKLKVEKVADARGMFLGVALQGYVPVLIKGNSYRYTLDAGSLSRISADEESVVNPFLQVADASGYFRLQIGRERLQEFYYRVLPGLVENPCVELEDTCAEEAAAYLPPEPVFTFYLDMDEKRITMRGTVRYGEAEYPLRPVAQINRGTGEYRDKEQESRVLREVQALLPYNAKKEEFEKELTDDFLFDFLTSGIPVLEYYGTVKATSAFHARRVIPQPHIQLGIAIDGGGLLNIGVTSKDLSTSDLLELYNSYKKKKRYYRIRSGDLIDLTHDTEMAEMEKFMEELDILPADVIREKVRMPLYRALYLDRMLENHEQLASTRDRMYRALIRNFKTVRDAEYEVPENMENVLRGYQVYGYKWLRTLQEAGFGGILADEMGLGKTVQMISVFQADREKEKEDHLPSLVVCPASLVYNWQEEVNRFAPELKCVPVAGTAENRKQILTEGQDTDVYVTSYDLLRRDVVLYENLKFRNCVLDEAQYIKNARAAVSKSVKLIHAEHRFALTGTPIENRLLELWSIFDFLMPGFLYGQKEFSDRFELPIAKQKDEEATARLRAMTGPFILRRRKTDVLTDLPPKLEEVRYARFSGRQQQLYDAQVVRMKKMLAGGELAGEEKIKMFAELTRIRQICCDPSLVVENYDGGSAKRDACMELIHSAMEGGHRMLLFSQFVSMLELLEEDLKAAGIPYYKIVGATPKEKRISLVRAFNEGDVPVFLISLKAGGTGLNLTGADVVIHYDPWWNLAAQNQATDRSHRIGQTKQVTVIRLIMKDTIEERILALQDAKKDLAEAILEGEKESLLSMSSEELLALLG